MCPLLQHLMCPHLLQSLLPNTYFFSLSFDLSCPWDNSYYILLSILLNHLKIDAHNEDHAFPSNCIMKSTMFKFFQYYITCHSKLFNASRQFEVEIWLSFCAVHFILMTSQSLLLPFSSHSFRHTDCYFSDQIWFHPSTSPFFFLMIVIFLQMDFVFNEAQCQFSFWINNFLFKYIQKSTSNIHSHYQNILNFSFAIC